MLKFSDIAQYLPYCLRVQYDQTDWVLDSLIFGNETAVIGTEDEQEAFVPISQIKPYFRPLTQLAYEIEHKGKKFVPIVELARISECIDDETIELNLDIENNIVMFFCEYTGVEFWYRDGYFGSTNYDYDLVLPSKNQKALFDKMIEWHFWLGDQSLFETGEILTLPAK